MDIFEFCNQIRNVYELFIEFPVINMKVLEAATGV